MARVPFKACWRRVPDGLVDLGLAFGAHRNHHGSLQLPNHVVVQNDAMRGLRHATRHQLVGDLIGSAIRELHFLARRQRSSTHQSLLHCKHGFHHCDSTVKTRLSGAIHATACSAMQSASYSAYAFQRPFMCVTSSFRPNTSLKRADVKPCSKSPVYTMVPGPDRCLPHCRHKHRLRCR